MKSEYCSNGAKLQKLAEIVPLDIPLSLSISPNNVCNLKCRYCYHGSKGKETDVAEGIYRPKKLTSEEFDRFIENCNSFGNPFKQVTLIGCGEPLVNENLAYMIRTLKEKGVAEKVKISTNAVLLTNERTDALLDAGLDVLKVSLQGLSAEKYREMCGVEIDFQLLVSRIQYFYERRGNCTVHIKIVDGALGEGEDLLFHEIFDQISDYAAIEKLSDVDEKGRWQSVTGRWESVKKVDVCYFPFYYVMVLENGDIYPCCSAEPEIRMGNLMTDSLKTVWETKIRKLCRAHLSGNRKACKACANCVVLPTLLREENYLDDKRDAILERLERL